VEQDTDAQVRNAAFAFLKEHHARLGDVLPWGLLHEGFRFRGARVPLLSQQGIFKPAACDYPISIRTTPEAAGKPRPYDDGLLSDGRLSYRYRGTDPRHWQNVGLRALMQHRKPLIYFFGIVKGQYLPVWPVFIDYDEPNNLRFLIRLDVGAVLPGADEAVLGEGAANIRRYAVRQVKQRLHQATFRERVLQAYRDRCAICRLRHRELLEAAHIKEDSQAGAAEVWNGLALCNLHHAAFDHHILGIRPDLVIEVRHDILRETDGPMLQHGLQGFDGERVHVPRSGPLQPNRDLLAERYERFKEVG
jgi:putative restriction endonuclease